MYFLPHPKAKLRQHNQKLSEENEPTVAEIGMKCILFLMGQGTQTPCAAPLL